MNSCDTCKYGKECSSWVGIASKSYEQALQAAAKITTADKEIEIKLGEYDGIIGYGLYSKGKDGAFTCDNQYSEYYMHGMSRANVCNLWTYKKETKQKIGLDVFNNYKCEGQLSFTLDGNIIEDRQQV